MQARRQVLAGRVGLCPLKEGAKVIISGRSHQRGQDVVSIIREAPNEVNILTLAD